MEICIQEASILWFLRYVLRQSFAIYVPEVNMCFAFLLRFSVLSTEAWGGVGGGGGNGELINLEGVQLS